MEIRKYSSVEIQKFKDLLERKPPKGKYVNLEWGVPNSVRYFINKILHRLFQRHKDRKMIGRLMSQRKR